MQSLRRTASSHRAPGLAPQRRCAQRDTCCGLSPSPKLQQVSSNSVLAEARDLAVAFHVSSQPATAAGLKPGSSVPYS